MPTKYPCGNCDIGVRFSGIKCTGKCKKWYHSGCQNIPEKSLKKWTDSEIAKWQCITCRRDQQLDQEHSDPNLNLNTTPITPDRSFQGLENSFTQCVSFGSTTPSLPPSLTDLKLDEVKSKLIDHEKLEDQDLEKSLTLAAEAGTILLQENNELKNNIHYLNSRISLLEANSLSKEAKVEELSAIEIKHIQKIEILLNKLEDVEQELIKCKQDKSNLQNIFEEHDIKQLDMLTGYLYKIDEQEKIISKLKTMTEQTDSYNFKTFKDMETQTTFVSSQSTNPNPASLLELALVLEKFDHMEQSMADLASYVMNNYAPLPAIKADVLNTIMGQEDQNKEINIRKTQKARLTKLKPVSELKSKNYPIRQTRKSNYFSVSLQVKKCRDHKTPEFDLITPDQTIQKSGGARQTPSQKLISSLATQGSGPIPDQHAQKSGGARQTPSQKLKIPDTPVLNSNKIVVDAVNLKITVLHQNIQGLKNKTNRLVHLLEEVQPRILILTEHGLKEDILKNIKISGYTLATYFSRSNHTKGGAAINVDENIFHLTEKNPCFSILSRINLRNSND
ncbi:hypothetical protein J6590_017014 [Homalodisca vitripennis]|nr:hypothetical protein J6590_017014 [Homalodisca vitripennis]